MDFSKNIKAFLNVLPVKKLNGQQKFLAVAGYCASGSTLKEVNISDVQEQWSKSTLQVAYHPTFYSRAQVAGWIDPVRAGTFVVTEEGIQHLKDISALKEPIVNVSTGGIYIFDKKSTHSFDKFLRGEFAKAQRRVWIADSWVDETIFDNVLDSAQSIVEMRLIYSQKRGSYDNRMSRFVRQYSKFQSKRYTDLHDRFLVIDDIGYVLGPSIKDAAANSPALVVVLNQKDSQILERFFQTLWGRAK